MKTKKEINRSLNQWQDIVRMLQDDKMDWIAIMGWMVVGYFVGTGIYLGLKWFVPWGFS